MIRVGPAGWSYPDWQGTVYPEPKPRGFHPLRYLAPFVDCVEVNSTFYALPLARNCARWVDLVADRPDFRFLVKVHQAFTHDPWTDARAAEASAFLEGIAPLAEAGRLSALLVQFPVTFQRSPDAIERLKHIRDLLGVHRLVLEVRHRTWFTAEGFDALRPLEVSLAHIDLPASSDHPPEEHEALGPVGYLRLHGRNRATWFKKGAGRDQRYDYLYDRTEITSLVERARRIAGRRDETYLVTNNHFRGQAMANAIEAKSLLTGRPVPAPAPLLAAFPGLADLAVPGDSPTPPGPSGTQGELFI